MTGTSGRLWRRLLTPVMDGGEVHSLISNVTTGNIDTDTFDNVNDRIFLKVSVILREPVSRVLQQHLFFFLA